jgi:hypothetical protein
MRLGSGTGSLVIYLKDLRKVEKEVSDEEVCKIIDKELNGNNEFVGVVRRTVVFGKPMRIIPPGGSAPPMGSAENPIDVEFVCRF